MPVTTIIDPARYIINVGFNIQGYADGVFSSFEFDEDEVNDSTGADGFTTAIKSNNHTGSLTVTLLQSSPSNDDLNRLRQLFLTSPKGFFFPLTVKNLLNAELIIASAAWIRKAPVLSQGKEIENREWVIRAPDAIVTAAGNPIFSGN